MISVIVPVYNVEQYLPKCIDSIIGQTYYDLEILLIDDGSTDKSGEICDYFALKDSRIKVYHRENSGVSDARNLGIEKSTGEFIAFVDGDDYIETMMYEKLLNAISNAQIVFCRFSYDYPDKSVLRYENNLDDLKDFPFDYSLFSGEEKSHYDQNKYVCDRVFGSVWRQLFKSEIIKGNNILFLRDLKIAEDRLFLLDYLRFCTKASIVDEYLYHYRMNEDSATSTVFGRFNPDLAKRNATLLKNQIELSEKNDKMSPDQQDKFLLMIKFQAISEIVQNEIRFNARYKDGLNDVFKDSFLKKVITLPFIFKIKKLYGKKKAVYALLIYLRRWKLIKNRIC